LIDPDTTQRKINAGTTILKTSATRNPPAMAGIAEKNDVKVPRTVGFVFGDSLFRRQGWIVGDSIAKAAASVAGARKQRK
jgi:hypothetical protein